MKKVLPLIITLALCILAIVYSRAGETTIIAKPGIIRDWDSTKVYHLECEFPNEDYETCVFRINLQVGDYYYYSKDGKDTVLFLIGSERSSILKEKENSCFKFSRKNQW